MIKKILLTIVLFFAVQLHSMAQDGKLNKGKESLKTSSSSTRVTNTRGSKDNNSRRSPRSRKPRNNDFIFSELFLRLFAYTAYGALVETPFEYEGRMHGADISEYPYQNSGHGNFIYSDSLATNYTLTRLDVYNHFLVENKNLYGNDFGLNFRFLKRFALDLEYLHLIEKVNDRRDSITLYSALLKYHRIRTQRFDAWFGLGIMHVGSDVNQSGFGLGVGAELFIKKPISVDFSHKWTNINQAEVHKTKLVLKYHIKNYQISTGYEHFKIGISKIPTFSFGLGVSL